jgi:hypothetical protein
VELSGLAVLRPVGPSCRKGLEMHQGRHEALVADQKRNLLRGVAYRRRLAQARADRVATKARRGDIDRRVRLHGWLRNQFTWACLPSSSLKASSAVSQAGAITPLVLEDEGFTGRGSHALVLEDEER